ncbi:hypothetical protein VNI00_010360 [Paramarasmius palmivorus]|uniref:Uncharacterized protein n=1 Tax=Paramarasmius palmivorus TaxID=297713 RepID=A0AAW0CIN0_9AGAR
MHINSISIKGLREVLRKNQLQPHGNVLVLTNLADKQGLDEWTLVGQVQSISPSNETVKIPDTVPITSLKIGLFNTEEELGRELFQEMNTSVCTQFAVLNDILHRFSKRRFENSRVEYTVERKDVTTVTSWIDLNTPNTINVTITDKTKVQHSLRFQSGGSKFHSKHLGNHLRVQDVVAISCHLGVWELGHIETMAAGKIVLRPQEMAYVLEAVTTGVQEYSTLPGGSYQVPSD